MKAPIQKRHEAHAEPIRPPKDLPLGQRVAEMEKLATEVRTSAREVSAKLFGGVTVSLLAAEQVKDESISGSIDESLRRLRDAWSELGDLLSRLG